MSELLAELFETYYKDIYTYLYGLSHDAPLSEDLASEVFVEVVRSISSFRGESDIKTWLFTIARRKWFAYLRKKNRQVQTQSIHDLYDTPALGAEDDSAAKEAADLISGILKQEPVLTREVVRMRLEGYSYYEISVRYNISEASARVIYFRAKAKIKKHLEKEGFRYE